MKKFKAFTLAEVLIVVAIIGVVAVLTLPVLMDNIGNKALETQNKKAQAVLANGIKMLTVQDGTQNLKDTELKKCRNNKECIAAQMKRVFKVVDDNISSPDNFNETYLLDEESDREFNAWSEDEGVNYAFVTADGTMFGVIANHKDRTTLTMIADANGKKTPNTIGEDLCVWSFDESGRLITTDENCPTGIRTPGQCSTQNLGACSPTQCNNLPSSSSGSMYCEYYWNGNSCVGGCSYIQK